ncbi:MAG TPA: serine/threonine-protein kinase [Acidimicrobiales bacterium]
MSSDAYLGRTLGRYTIEATIGSGGFATVYRAVDTVLERPVALKVLDPSAHRNDTVARRFVNEGKSVARLDHPAIVPVYDAGQTDGLLWMAMRLVEGPPLDDAFARRRFSRAEVAAIVDRIAGALDHAHAQGVVHRDVKPSNILLEHGEPERAWLADFGIAATARTAGRYTTGTLGTAAYMAPEQARPGDVGPSADIYSLGCVVYLLATGRPPFPGDDHVGLLMAHATEPVPPVGDEALDAVLRHALAKNPADRPPTAKALADELRPVLVDSAAPDSSLGDAPTALGETAAHEAAIAELRHQPTLAYGPSAIAPPDAALPVPPPPPGFGAPGAAPGGAPGVAPGSGQPGAVALGGVPGGGVPGGAPAVDPALAGAPASGPGGHPAPSKPPTVAGRAARRGRLWFAVGLALVLAGVVAAVVALLSGDDGSADDLQCDAAGICFDLPEGWALGEAEPGRGRLERDGEVVALYLHQQDRGIDLMGALARMDGCEVEPVEAPVGGEDGAVCDNPDGSDPEYIAAAIVNGRAWRVIFAPNVPASDIDHVVDGIEFRAP